MPDQEMDKICPNCGQRTTGNYCANCGQETHLHKDTFWGLVSHFVGDYFHYDSKFWQTIKALLFDPGKLTLAYWNQQRMRYLKPVPLYIFISAVFFIISVNTPTSWLKANFNSKNEPQDTTALHSKSFNAKLDNSDFNKYLSAKIERLTSKHEDVNEFIVEKIQHYVPKIYFFMIPAMALLLKLIFRKRKDLYFADHAIFALHYHAFWFVLFTIGQPAYPETIKMNLYLLLYIIAFVYMAAALRNVYKISVFKATLNTFTIAVFYLVLLALVFIATLLLIFSFI